MSMFQPGDRVQMVDCAFMSEFQADMMKEKYGIVSKVRNEGEDTYLDVVFDDRPYEVCCGWLPWRFRLIEDDFEPSELGIEVLL